MNPILFADWELKVRQRIEEGATAWQLSRELGLSQVDMEELLKFWQLKEKKQSTMVELTPVVVQKPPAAVKSEPQEPREPVIKAKSPKQSPEEKEKMVARLKELLNNGVPVKEIAKEFQKTEPAIRCLMNISGLRVVVKAKKTGKPKNLENQEGTEMICENVKREQAAEVNSGQTEKAEEKDVTPATEVQGFIGLVEDLSNKALDSKKSLSETFFGERSNGPNVEKSGSFTPSGFTDAASHYQGQTQQPIEIMVEYLTADQMAGFLRGNVIKYALRAGRKGSVVQDAEKAAQYALWLASFLRDGTVIAGRGQAHESS